VRWREPLDWNRGAGRPQAARAEGVDVIIPVYGGADVLGPCLASVVAHTDLTRHGLIIVADGPQDGAVENLLNDFNVLRNETRRGFVASANAGMRASTRDVVLLNSDTVVSPRWLEKLIDAAASSGDAGTVTPLSNYATLVSVPRGFEENLLPKGFDTTSFGALVEHASAREYPRIPTAVGVCMYIRRALLDDIGFFDEKHFGLGYGEENDFSMRALARGWLHLADDATFIYHAGHRSFGAERMRSQRRGAAAMRRKHRRYMPTIAKFMQDDPLAPVRARIHRALTIGTRQEHAEQLRVVHLVHGWPPFQQGGTELYAYWLARQQALEHHVAVYTRSADPMRNEGDATEWLDDGVRVRRVTNNFTARNPIRRNALRHRKLERDFERFLREERPTLLHVHHLAGHAFSMAGVAKKLGIPIVLQIQDWWFLCARVNFFDSQWNRCSGPGLAKCARCAPLTKIAPAPLWNRVLHVLRRREARRAVGACDAFIAGSQSIGDDFTRAGILPKGRTIRVIPYGISLGATHATRPPATRPIRFGFVGALSPHKGLHVAIEAMRGFRTTEATLRVWGDPAAFPEYVKSLRSDAPVFFEGKFADDEKPRVFESMDVLLIPSVGLESFGLAAREAMTSGVPVIATEGGALSEMFEPGHGGDFFPAGDATALRALLRRVIDDPSVIDEWRRLLPRPKTADAHADEIMAVYETVLG
jgi:glycosyltransferase involved in cell wall biosynthesis/GT2 family glycosyltransferase